MPSWLPARDSDRLTWLQNFALKLNVHVGEAGIVAGDVTMVNRFRDQYQWILNRTDQLRTASQDVTALKTIMTDGPIGATIGAYPTAPAYPAAPAAGPDAGIFPQIIALAERIRNTAGYTPALGEDLGIVPLAAPPAPRSPSFTTTIMPNSEVRVNWVKASYDGVLIESQRAGETVWTNLGTDRFSPFVDTRPPLVAGQPEVRRYQLRYLEGDDPVAFYSAIATVTTIP